MNEQPPLDLVDFEDDFLQGPCRSENDLNIYVTLVASLGFVYFVLTFAAPQVVMAYLLPANSPFHARMGAEIPKTGGAVYWQDELWVPVLKVSAFSGQQSVLRPYPSEGQPELDQDLSLPVEVDRWVVDGTVLWGVSADRVVRIEDRTVTLQYPKRRLNQSSKPFLQQGVLHIVARNPASSWMLYKLELGEWVEVGEIALPSDEATAKLSAMPIVPGNATLPRAVAQQFGRVDVVSGPFGTPRLLLSNGVVCWISSTIPLASPSSGEDHPVSALSPTLLTHDSEASSPWRQLTDVPRQYWEAICDHDTLYFAELQSAGLQRDVIVYAVELNSDAQPLSCRVHGQATGAALESISLVQAGDQILLVSDSFPPGGVRRWTIEPSGIVASGKTKSGHPLIQSFGGELFKVQLISTGVSLATLLAFALTLSMLMTRFRHRRYVFGHQQVRLASFGRRAFARGVDGFLASILPVGAMILLYWNVDLQAFLDAVFQNPIQNLIRVAYFFLAMLAYSAATTVLFGVLEGLWGWSPGKGLVGIRVTRTSLVPIGLLRGILRQFLLVVDAQPNYLIGSLMIALMSKCQRLGDLATDAIVIEKPA